MNRTYLSYSSRGLHTPVRSFHDVPIARRFVAGLILLLQVTQNFCSFAMEHWGFIRTEKMFQIFFIIHLFRCCMTSKSSCGALYNGYLFEDFHGDRSFLSYEINALYMKENTLDYQDRFCSRTSRSNGIIAHLVSFEYEEEIVLEAINGHVGVQLISKGEIRPECLFTLNKPVEDGVNHKIKMELRGARLRLDLFRRSSAISDLTVANITSCLRGNFSTFIHLERGGQKVGEAALHGRTFRRRVGSVQLGKPHLFGNFRGCMGDAMINGIPLAKAAHEIERHDVDPSCDDTFDSDCTDACATTYERVKEDKCACPDESEMNTLGLCVPSCNCIACQNGGLCITEFGGGVGCKCSPGYEGPHCEEQSCAGVTCLNGGTCVVQPRGAFCNCGPEFTGGRCEVPLPPDPCDACQNNATCERNVPIEGNVHCACLPGYHGNFCEGLVDSSASSEISPTKITLISLSAIIIAGTLIGFSICFFLKRRRTESSTQQSESEGKEMETPCEMVPWLSGCMSR